MFIYIIFATIGLIAATYGIIWLRRYNAARAKQRAEQAAWDALSLVEKLAYTKFPKGTVLYDRKRACLVRMDRDLAGAVAVTKDRFRAAMGEEITCLGDKEIVQGIVSADWRGLNHVFQLDMDSIIKISPENFPIKSSENK